MKKTLPDGSIIEGSASEIAEYEAMVRFHGTPAERAEMNVLNNLDDWEFVSAEVGFRALTRIKLAPKTKAVLKKLYENGDKWTSAKRLQELVEYSPAQFAGLMGAFGRRVANTRGYVRDSSFFEYDWSDEESCYFYRLPPSSREAVERARLV